MKIVLAAKSVYPFHPVGGVQKYVYNFAKYLKQYDVELEIVAPLDSGCARAEIFEGLRYTFLRPSIYKYLEYPIGWLGVHLFSQSLARYLQTIDFDLLHAFDMTGFQYLKVKKREPVIAHIFTDNYLINPIGTKNPFNFLNLTGQRFNQIKREKVRLSPFSDGTLKRRYWLQYLLKTRPMHFCLSQSEAIFFEAQQFKEEVSELFKLDPSNGYVVPAGVDINFIEGCLENSTMTRKDLGLGEDDIILMTVNRLAADKGVDKIILALAEIIKINPTVKLMMVGSGYQERELYGLMDEKNLRSHILHFKDVDEKKLYNFYKLSNIYISAFSYPGSSISTLEAMACSLPVITTAQPWLIQGKNGLLIENNHPVTICRAVLKLIEQKDLCSWGKMSRNISLDYDWSKVVRKAMENYEQIKDNGQRVRLAFRCKF